MSLKRKHIYCDGSYAVSMGIGWVICAADGAIVEEKRKTLPRPPAGLEKSASLIAEIMAAATALNTLHADSTVTVHTDNLMVRRFINRTFFVARDEAGVKKLETADQRTPALHFYWNELEKALRRHRRVNACEEGTDTDFRLKLAHNLASRASGSRYFYDMRTGKKCRAHEKADLVHVWDVALSICSSPEGTAYSFAPRSRRLFFSPV